MRPAHLTGLCCRSGPDVAGPCTAGPSRRTVLRSGGIAAGTLALVGCGDGDAASPVQTEADGAFRVPTSDTVAGSSTYYPEARIIVSQPTDGDFRAFDARCPHQGCMTSDTGQDGELLCPCHGSRFDPASGEVLAGPATTGLTALTVETDGEDLLIRG